MDHDLEVTIEAPQKRDEAWSEDDQYKLTRIELEMKRAAGELYRLQICIVVVGQVLRLD